MIEMLTTVFCVNPITSISDQDRISPYMYDTKQRSDKNID